LVDIDFADKYNMNPIDNKYSKWYKELIISRLGRTINGYAESHHIIPKCLGGDDTVSNLILLYPREHFIAHLLLTKMYTGQEKHKMNFAFGMMLAENTQRNKRYKPTARFYEIARKLVGLAVSSSNKGKIPWNKGIPRDNKVKEAVSKANKGRTAWNKNIQRTDEDRLKMKTGWLKKKADGFIAHNKGKKETLVICEHCNKHIGGKANYTRWHGNNCKMKEYNAN